MNPTSIPEAANGSTVVAYPPFRFDNSYARELEGFYVAWQAEASSQPRLLRLNADLARDLELDVDTLNGEIGATIFSGNATPAGAVPLAQAYAGHQFGGFSPQLGDGRALLLGEVIDRRGQRRDIALKGSGRTPFSRSGDGRAALGPVLREYLIGEAMHALGIPTTRALAAVLTGEFLFRETPQPGAILTRVAASHLRVGTFEFFAARGEHDKVRRLVDYAIARHYADLAQSANPAIALLDAVCQAQAALVARWMHVGFIHGVMNTDNMTISGETIDYGPCAFMDKYDPETVFSSIDHHGRYAYANQPKIAQWNIARLAEALLPLIDDDRERGIQLATDAVRRFEALYEQRWLEGMRAKIGLTRAEPGDVELCTQLLTVMAVGQSDYTMTFRALATASLGEDAPLRQLLDSASAWEAWETWAGPWRARMAREDIAPDARAEAMNRVNPVYVPRNHLVEDALAAAAQNNELDKFDTLLSVLSDPFGEREGLERFARPSPDGNAGYRTFCGT